jgi:hypothetical protein
MRRWALLLPALLAGCAPQQRMAPGQFAAAPVQHVVFPPSMLPQVNQQFTGAMPFLNRNMTLPEGSWKVASTQALTGKGMGLVGALVALVRTDGPTLRGILLFAGNARPAPGGFPISNLCQASDVIWNDVRVAQPNGEQDCATINFERPALWRALPRGVVSGIMGQLDLLNVQPPNIVVSVAVHEANLNWSLDETLITNPELAGIPPDMSTQRAQSAWTAFRVARDPARQHYVESLQQKAAPIRMELRRLIQAPAPYVPQSGLTPA